MYVVSKRKFIDAQYTHITNKIFSFNIVILYCNNTIKTSMLTRNLSNSEKKLQKLKKFIHVFIIQAERAGLDLPVCQKNFSDFFFKSPDIF